MSAIALPKVMSGSYQDYITKNTSNKKFRFRLLNKNMSSSFTDSKGRSKLYVDIFDFPAFGIINELVKGVWTQRVIRYIPGEPSIYKDEQSSDEKIPKKLYKIRFERGEKTIGGNETLLLEFMMKCNLNATNKNRRTDINAEFELVDTDKYIKEQMAVDESLDEAKYFCRKGDWDEVKAVAMVLGLSPSFTTEETRWNLRAIAERDPVKFLNIQKDPKMKMKYHVLEAIEKGFLVTDYKSNTIAWTNNRNMPIYTALIGRDVIDGFVNQLSTADGKLLYNALLTMIYPDTEEINTLVIPTREELIQAKNHADPVEPMIKDCKLSETELNDLINKGVAQKIIISKGVMPWLTYKGGKYRQNEGLMDYLKGNEKMLDILIDEVQ